MTNNTTSAVQLLGLVTHERYDIWALAGPDNARRRAEIMAVLTGVPKVPQSKAGVYALQKEFYDRVQPEGGCNAARDTNFREKCRQMMAAR